MLQLLSHGSTTNNNCAVAASAACAASSVVANNNFKTGLRNGDGAVDVADVMRREIAAGRVDGPFFVLDAGAVARSVSEWRAAAPGVVPACSVRCNPNASFLRCAVEAGMALLCSTPTEVAAAVGAGACASEVVFSSAVLLGGQLRAVAAAGVRRVVVGSPSDISKVAKVAWQGAGVELVVRAAVPEPAGLGAGGSTGADVAAIASAAAAAGLAVVGVAVELGAADEAGVLAAVVATAQRAVAVARAAGHAVGLVVLGAGCPGVRARAGVAGAALMEALGQGGPSLAAGVTVVADIGRAVAGPAMALAVNVFARRDLTIGAALGGATPAGAAAEAEAAAVILESSVRSGAMAESAGVEAGTGIGAGGVEFLYYVSDGVYGSFSCMIFDNAVVTPKPLVVASLRGAADSSSSKGRRCTVFGPTCDGIDVIAKQTVLPELAIGDWLVFEDMGAYTLAEATGFNGFGAVPVLVADCL